jgi:hypothetical protein
MDARNAQKRMEILRKGVAQRQFKDEEVKRAKMTEVHVCMEHDNSTMKRLQPNKISKTLLDKTFGVDVDYLEDQFGNIGALPPWRRVLEPSSAKMCAQLSLQCGRTSSPRSASSHHLCTLCAPSATVTTFAVRACACQLAWPLQRVHHRGWCHRRGLRP